LPTPPDGGAAVASFVALTACPACAAGRACPACAACASFAAAPLEPTATLPSAPRSPRLGASPWLLSSADSSCTLCSSLWAAPGNGNRALAGTRTLTDVAGS
jgi:hypothetical protein